MKGGIQFLEIIFFFGSYQSSKLNDTILLYAHRHIAVTMITLKALKDFNGFITDCVLLNVDYKNFSDMDSKPLTECIKKGIFTLVPQ